MQIGQKSLTPTATQMVRVTEFIKKHFVSIGCFRWGEPQMRSPCQTIACACVRMRGPLIHGRPEMPEKGMDASGSRCSCVAGGDLSGILLTTLTDSSI